MFKFFMGNSIWHLVVNTDIVSKMVLTALFLLSILCWTIFFYKLILFGIKKRQVARVAKALNKATSFEELISVAASYKDTLPGYFLSKNFSFLKNMLVIDPDTGKAQIGQREWDLFLQHMDQNIEDIVHHEQSYLPILSTSAAMSPLLGLFGTVWGLVNAFISISQKQSADIATVAPGIASALVTTLAGLAVAVPALVMYNYCASQVRKIDQLFTVLADRLILKIQKYVIK
ncbi:MotA/TolQ/ExbB proton channel family protein [Candidatus Dependentiae bacterium]